MLHRTSSARGQKNPTDSGFTLIELLVVVLIIGILAAIAIPVYLGVQNNAKDDAAKNDVVNAKIALVAYRSDNPTAATNPAINTAAAVQALNKYGATLNTGTTGLNYSGAATYPKFCITATSSTGVMFWVTDVSGIIQATSAPSGCQ